MRCDAGLAQNLSLRCQPWALPVSAGQHDLVVPMLESPRTRNRCCAKSSGVLGPRGRSVIAGLNPLSQGPAAARRETHGDARQRILSVRRLLIIGLARHGNPDCGLGCHAPPMRDEKWLRRLAFMDRAGAARRMSRRGLA